ncbi:TonB-dependent receptor [Niveispirillum sp. SYP-B3756]|uniref:TonB-dependent receptor n=1 Tax=Niveispirillum sp. SYP-B3756 TaxID=2662178 RepID=UPI001291B1DF|nr:TonB-dependent receptor [Niveispirillum sp. SYP-B3756]MQP65006.1 TonB-dependent receptor [Niveispirillum sp. SYP-B3756]
MMTRSMMCSAVTLMCLAAPAMAQGTADNAEYALDEIVVTAQKRQQSAQDVPVAMSVIGGDALANVGGSRLQDLTQLSPSLTVTQGGDQNNNSVVLRGIGTSAFSVGVEAAVLVVIDDVAVGLSGQGFNDLQDIERIEVLRGPQSTLFGKSASAGVINITTKAPTDTFSGSAEVTVTDDDEQRYAAGLSGPISNDLSFRLSAAIGRYDGNIKNVTTGRMINGRDTENYRGKLLWQPSDKFDAAFSAYYSKTEADCCEFVSIRKTPGLRNLFGVTTDSQLAGITPGPNNFDARVDPDPVSDAKDYGGNLKVNLYLDDHVLTNITARSHYAAHDLADFDGASGPLFGLPNGLTQFGFFRGDTFSNELRLATTSQADLQYVAGLYYADNSFTRRFTRTGPASPGDWRGETGSKTYAIFGQADYAIAQGTKLIAGLRWSREDISFTYDRYLNAGGNPPFKTSGSADDSVITGKAGIQQDIADDVMGFATYSRGYKGQAFDLTTSFTRPDNPARNPVQPETANSYELGMKGSFLNRRARLSLTGFLTDYNNFQAQSQVAEFGGSLFLANVGKLRTKGVEAEGSWLATDSLTLNGSVAYVDAVIRSFPTAECYFGQTAAQGCTVRSTGGRAQDLAGHTLANSPKWKFNVGADWELPLGELPFTSTVNVNYAWQSEVNFDLRGNPNTVQDSYGITNLSIAFEDKAEGRYRLTLFARNLFDKHYFSSVNDLTNGLIANPYPNPSTAIDLRGRRARDASRYLGARFSIKY